MALRAVSETRAQPEVEPVGGKSEMRDMSAQKQHRESTVIVGLGGTGLSCARYLLARGEPFTVVDSRPEPPGLAALKSLAPKVKVQTGGFHVDTLKAAARLVLSPGVSLKTPEIQEAITAGVPVTGDIGLFVDEAKSPLVAVTGSNGKSTVVALLSHILRATGKRVGVGGNLDGRAYKPALDLLLEAEQEGQPDLYLLELSSFQLETAGPLGAEVAVLLNLSQDHMDRYASLADYLAAKQRVFHGCRKVVVNRDDAHSPPPPSIQVPVWEFGVSSSAGGPSSAGVSSSAGGPVVGSLGLLEEGGSRYLAYEFEPILPLAELPLCGHHNIANALAAAALALALGADIPAIRKGLLACRALPHRCQRVADIDGVAFYNDSKATNVGATRAAIEGLGEQIRGHIILIAGGMAKGADFSALQPVVNRWGKAVVLLGQDAEALAAALDKDTVRHFATDMEDAVRIAMAHAAPGDAVLLSPACASFDMFTDFQHRGEAFIQAVHRLRDAPKKQTHRCGEEGREQRSKEVKTSSHPAYSRAHRSPLEGEPAKQGLRPMLSGGGCRP